MKKAYLVISPESSGNRMMIRALESAIDFGDGGHNYKKTDSFSYVSKWIGLNAKLNKKLLREKMEQGAPEMFTYVQSVPYNGPPNKRYPPIAAVCTIIRDFDYKIYPIVFHRTDKFLNQSQVKAGHATDLKMAKEHIEKAYEHIFAALASVHIQPIIIKYETFATSKEYRKWIFELLDLPEPKMEFFNANKKYK